MEKLPRQIFTKEFREQAVKLVTDEKLTVPAAARRLSVSAKTLANWVYANRQGKLEEVDANRRPVTELEAEVSRLRRELTEAKMERDILKNRPTRPAEALMNRNSGRVHWMHAETVAVSFLEV